MSRIPAQGAVATVGAFSVLASVWLFGGVASAGAADTTTPPLSLSAASVPFAGSTAGTTAVVGVSSAGLLAGAAVGAFSLVQPVPPALSVPSASSGQQTAAAESIDTAVAPATAVAPVTPVKAATPAAKPALQPAIVTKKAAVLTPRSVAQTLASSRGWTGAQWVCLDKLWQHESKYQTTARNSRSGAYGIPQALPASKMASAGSDWRTNPTTQVTWGLNYIKARYGTPCGAWQHEEYHGSY